MARERNQGSRFNKPGKSDSRKPGFKKEEGRFRGKPGEDRPAEGESKRFRGKPREVKPVEEENKREGKKFIRQDKTDKPLYTKKPFRGPASQSGRKRAEPVKVPSNPNLIRLNKYIADAGICSRREADKLIAAGTVAVNGKVVTELGVKVSPEDKVTFGDQKLSREKPRYVLLNKPKGFVTSVDDPHHEKTVMHLVANACKERIYPVGRLDRNTTGLLLFTNDGEIAKKLTHPRYGVKKIYHVGLDKPLSKGNKAEIEDGIELDDGLIKVDAIEYVEEGANRKEIGVELHSGKNRIVRRIFEKFGYKVIKLDRVYYAGLTKKNLPRGTWRLLEEKEINMLKMLS